MMRVDAHQHFWHFDPVRDTWITDEMANLRRDFLPDELESHLAENGLDGRCFFTGRVAQSLAKRCTARASVLVSPRKEGTNTPLKIYEQLASGVPLVATRIPSHTQVLDDEVCFLVDPDPESMAEGLLAALTEDDRRARIVRNALELYETKYSRRVYEGKMRGLLEVLS